MTACEPVLDSLLGTVEAGRKAFRGARRSEVPNLSDSFADALAVVPRIAIVAAGEPISDICERSKERVLARVAPPTASCVETKVHAPLHA